ncbi:permease [Corynebacterium incognita]|uniref:Permease n=1 Tax=Corynebacterium incognita TaxID=2754725 RepID=A0A7G7CQN1_9CORY|nr:permease [Corynebacterium incognita]QNE89897.1 permease [Corynebacterium incognita]
MLEVVQTFAVLFAELFVLFLGVSFLVALVNRRWGPQRIQSWLAGGKVPAEVKGLALGMITPFCSCSTIPMFVNMLNSGVGFRTAATFLISSPLLNPIIVSGMWALFGGRIALSYAAIMVIVSLIIPVLWSVLGLEGHMRRVKVQGGKVGDDAPWQGVRKESPVALRTAWEDLRPLLLPMTIGVAIGAFIYGAVPAESLQFLVGDGIWWLVPLAAVVGIPLYVRLETMLPIGMALSGAGVAVGPIFALMVGGAGASPPELSMLSAVFKPKLLVGFVASIVSAAVIAGYAMTLLA